jgi:ubiquinone/menaquinone biosynthesis C-methylase UbiE
VKFVLGDSQNCPFADNTFDVVINECAVGIPDDSQKVLNEMLRVVKPGGAVAIHESTWKKTLSEKEKNEISERYGTTPLEFNEWNAMLEKAGTINIVSEFEQWSKPEMFWDIRKDRKVEDELEKRRLAAAARADERDRLARWKLQRHPAQDRRRGPRWVREVNI